MATAALVALGARADDAAPAPEDELLGIWNYETSFGPSITGDMKVERAPDGWRASVDGFGTTAPAKGDEIRLSFVQGIAEFRGKVAKDESTIDGYWIQGPTGADRTGQGFATPLTLRRSEKTWRGTVRPLDDTYTLWLRIFRDQNGVLVAAFRNPGGNSTGGSSQFRVARAADVVLFSASTGERTPDLRITATFLGSPDRLKLDWKDAGGAVVFTRCTAEEATAFYPRPPGTKYVYKVPPATGDGWTTGRAKDAGIDEAALVPVVQKIIDADPSEKRPVLMHSLLVARKGKLVLEEYFYGFDCDRPHDVRSAGKTFGSVMLGALEMRKKAIAPETKLYDLLAPMGPFANVDPRKSSITLAHLMTHTAGLACDDNDDASPGNEGTMQSQTREPNWWRYTLDLPMAHDPGTRYAYCSANSNLVGAALTTASGTWLPQLFDETIARPLQFGAWHWNLMPNGEGYLGGGAYLRPRDLLKIGQAYLAGGVWRGHRIVDADWVKTSTAARQEISPETTGLSADAFPQVYLKGQDGLAWHLNGIRAGDRVIPDYEATGNGGQLLIVVPELDMVVVFTGGNYGQGGIWNRWRNEIVGGGIVPALKNAGTLTTHR